MKKDIAIKIEEQDGIKNIYFLVDGKPEVIFNAAQLTENLPAEDLIEMYRTLKKADVRYESTQFHPITVQRFTMPDTSFFRGIDIKVEDLNGRVTEFHYDSLLKRLEEKSF